jgi:N-acyl-phosphatidylethanolamine-hydrolysing phospholipase D
MSSQHIDPREAVKIHLETGSRKTVAVHHQTFPLADERWDEPAELLRQACREMEVCEETEVVTLQHGGAVVC